MSVKNNLHHIDQKIIEACAKVGRKREEVEIIAVTKYVTISRTKEALQAGIKHLGENRDDGFIEKQSALKEEQVVWHFIGTLQSRKVRNIINKIDYLHSLDRLSLAKEIEKRADEKVKCFVQVNVSGEQSKFGLDPAAVIDFIKELANYPKIEVVGLMTMAPYSEDEKLLRNCFKLLRELQEEVQQLELPYAACEQLSMGMSNDYHIAIEEGATMVRIGSALVGEVQEEVVTQWD